MHFFKFKLFSLPIISILILASFFDDVAFAQSEKRAYLQQRQNALREFRLGHFDESEKLLLSALRQAELWNDDHAVALILSGVGDIRHIEERFGEAEDVYRRSLSMFRRVPNSDVPIAMVLRNLGSTYAADGRYREALATLTEASLLAKNLSGPQTVELSGQILNSFGMVYFYLRKFGKAASFFKQAEQAYSADATLGLCLGQTLNNLAQIEHSRHHFDKAEELYRKSVALVEKGLGSSHPELTVVLNNLGGLYIDSKRYRDAEDQFRRSLEIQEHNVPIIPGRIIHTYHELARTYLARGDRGSAEAVLAPAVDVATSNNVSSREAVDILESYAYLLNREGKRQQAEAVHSKAIRARATQAFTVHVKDLN